MLFRNYPSKELKKNSRNFENSASLSFSDMRVSNSSRKLQKNSPDQEIIEEHSTLASS